MKETIGEEIGDTQAWELTCLLVTTARNVPNEKDIQAIETTAGTFRGLAITVVTRRPSLTRRQILTNTAFVAAGLTGGALLHWSLSKDHTNQASGRNSSTANAQFPVINWKMPTSFGDSVRGTIVWDAPNQICERVKKMTKGRFAITLDRNGETLEILTNVNKGIYECGHSRIYYGESYKALYFSSAIPFGLNPHEQNAWLYYKKNSDDEETYVQSIYRKVGLNNIIAFPAGATGAQMGGWFKKRMKLVEDFRDLTIRIPGLGGDVLKALNVGVTTHSDLENAGKGKYPVDVCIEELKKGNFGAVEWTGPHDDIKLRLPDAANFYHYPGWWEPGTTFDVQINRDAWGALPPHYQAIFKVACFETHMETLAKYNQSNALAFKQMPKNVELVKFSKDILQAAKEATDKVLNNYAKELSFNEVYTEWRNFRNQIAWINNIIDANRE